MNTKKIFIATALLSVTGAANSAPITSLEITGGDFLLNDITGVITPGAFASMTIGGYDGSSPTDYGTQDAYAPTSIGTFNFGIFGAAAIYTAETDGVVSGFPGVTGDVTGGELTLDLSAWTLYWNATSINAGSSSDMAPGSVCVTTTSSKCSTPITTTYDVATGEFTAGWDAVFIGGATNGFLSTWNITGTVSAVPVPAAAWLFGSGLIGLIGFARRKKV